MCGITGIFNIESSAAPRPGALEAMVETIYHRGPDAKGVHPFPGGGLGSTRLAIIDLRPESNMPFCSSDGRYTIAYNGEVFNYVELREELEGLGHRFRTQSDTEVVIEAYRRWGPHAVERFNGMWAFAIHDSQLDELFCSRDRFGIKPFFYAHHKGQLLFASEIKALLAVAPELAAPNHAQFARFVAAAAMPETEDTFFAGISQLLPAHNLVADRKGLRTAQYWDYPQQSITIRPDEAAEQVRALLDDAIRLRLRSDVPVGMLLSAGVDSSAIACLVRQFEHGPFRAFTASYPGDPFDEAPAAATLAERLGIEHELIAEEGIDVLDTAKSAIWHLESPTSYSEIVPRWHIYRQMRGEITVAFEGQGADETFGGYTTENAPAAMRDALRHANVLELGATIRRQVAEVGWRTAARRGASNALSPDLVRQIQRARGHDFSTDGSSSAGTRRDGHGMPDSLTSQLYRQHTGQLRAQLRWGDAISMAHSIETRYPFLDYRLVELGFQLPGNIKMRRGVGKAVLRDAVRPEVPESVLRPQRKRGFGTPVQRWFRDNPERNLYPLLHDQTARSRDLFDITRVDSAARSLLEGQSDTSWLLFKWLTVELWFRLFIDAAPAACAPLPPPRWSHELGRVS